MLPHKQLRSLRSEHNGANPEVRNAVMHDWAHDGMIELSESGNATSRLKAGSSVCFDLEGSVASSAMRRIVLMLIARQGAVLSMGTSHDKVSTFRSVVLI